MKKKNMYLESMLVAELIIECRPSMALKDKAGAQGVKFWQGIL